jgi:GNAT superfamily N-acetyltransferase
MNIEVRDGAPEADAQVVQRGLIEHALASGVEPRNYRLLAVVLRDDAGTVVGGLVGATVWGWLHVEELWVAERLRGHGWGTRMLERAEREAVQRGCHGAHLDTFDFQALDFYQRLGYEVFGALDDFPTGHVRYFVRKRLADVETPPE